MRILASSAIPVQFNPVDFYNQTLVDGGIRNISPIAQVLPYNPDEIVVMPTKPLDDQQDKAKVNDILRIAKRSIDVMLEEIFKEDIKRFVQINRLVGQAAKQDASLQKPNGTPYKYIDSHIVAPQEPLGDSLDFSEDMINKRYEAGKKRARQVLELPDENESN